MDNPSTINKLTRKPPLKKSEASFTISQNAILTLLENKATTVQICSYLTLARSRRRHKSTSSTGLSAITQKVHIGKARAERTLSELMEMERSGVKLISKLPDRYTTERQSFQKNYLELGSRYKDGDYESVLQSLESLKIIKPSTPRWDLADSGGSVWLPDKLVGNKSDKTNTNLYRLMTNNNHVATRLLLLMYLCNDLELDAVCVSDIRHNNKIKRVLPQDQFSIYLGSYNNTATFSKRVTEYALGESAVDNHNPTLKKALDDLERLGFISRVMLMATVDIISGHPKSFYELDSKDSTKRKNCQPRIDLIIRDAVAKCEGISTRKDSRSYGNYYLVAPKDDGIGFFTAYRLRYRVEASNNFVVKSAADKRASRQQELLSWVKTFETTLHTNKIQMDNFIITDV